MGTLTTRVARGSVANTGRRLYNGLLVTESNVASAHKHVYSTSWCGRRSDTTHIVAPLCWDRWTHSPDKTCRNKRCFQTGIIALGASRSAIYYRSCQSARYRDSAVGELLSMLLFSIMGISLVLLSNQLFNRWVWGRDPASKVADVGTSRKPYRSVDVRNIRESFVCDRPAPRRL